MTNHQATPEQRREYLKLYNATRRRSAEERNGWRITDPPLVEAALAEVNKRLGLKLELLERRGMDLWGIVSGNTLVVGWDGLKAIRFAAEGMKALTALIESDEGDEA